MMKAVIIVVFLFIFEDVHRKINKLSNQLQEKETTSGKAVTLINGIIKIIEDERFTEKFKILWPKMVKFANNLTISLETLTIDIYLSKTYNTLKLFVAYLNNIHMSSF